jgi:hypothetical protein
MYRRYSFWLSLVLFTGALLLFSRLVAWSDQELGARAVIEESDDNLIYAPPTTFLQVVSLGYQHALADALWFRTIDYFGKHYRGNGLYPWLAHMCDRVTDLDPRAVHVYRFAGFILPWEADEVDAGMALLEKGTRNLPESWELRYMLGFSHYFFKDDLAASSRALHDAIALPGAPKFISDLLAVIDSTHLGPTAAMEFLAALARGAGSEEMRDAAQQRIRDLTLTSDIGHLEAAVQQLAVRRQRLPDDLSELVSEGLIDAVPADPFGGRYVIDPATGKVASTTGHKPTRLGSSKMRESMLRSERPGGSR